MARTRGERVIAGVGEGPGSSERASGFLERQLVGRFSGGRREPIDGDGSQRRVGQGCLGGVVGELLEVAAIVAEDVLDGLGHTGVNPRAAPRAELVTQRRPDEGMGEPEAVDADVVEQAGGHCLFEVVEYVELATTGRRCDDLQLEVEADHRCDAEHLLHCVIEAGEPTADGTADVNGAVTRVDRLEKQWIARGLRHDSVEVGVGTDQARGGVAFEAPETQHRRRGRTLSRGDEVSDPLIGVRSGVAGGDHHRHPCGLMTVSEVGQQLQRRVGRPMGVVDDEAHRRLSRGVGQPSADRLVEPVSQHLVVDRAHVGGWVVAPHEGLGHQTRQLAGVASQRLGPFVDLRGPGQHGAQHVAEGLVRHGKIFVVAPEQHPVTPRLGVLGDLGGSAGLADARLAEHPDPADRAVFVGVDDRPRASASSSSRPTKRCRVSAWSCSGSGAASAGAVIGPEAFAASTETSGRNR